MFKEADAAKSGCLEEQETVELVLKLNRQLSTSRIRQKFAVIMFLINVNCFHLKRREEMGSIS